MLEWLAIAGLMCDEDRIERRIRRHEKKIEELEIDMMLQEFERRREFKILNKKLNMLTKLTVKRAIKEGDIKFVYDEKEGWKYEI